MGRNNIVGSWGEALAAQYLLKNKYTLLATGYRCRFGEIDIIATQGDFLAFVEVKLRKSDGFAKAYEYVDKRKQDRIRTTASAYLAENPNDLQPRFDIIEVYAPEGLRAQSPQIIHWEGVF